MPNAKIQISEHKANLLWFECPTGPIKDEKSLAEAEMQLFHFLIAFFVVVVLRKLFFGEKWQIGKAIS